MLTVLFIVLAAICNAFMDALENENFHESIFKFWNTKFWYKRESWKYSPELFGYKVDGWHLTKSCMIVFIMLAVIFFPGFNSSGWQLLIDVSVLMLIFGSVWNFTFWLFYHKIFKIK